MTVIQSRIGTFIDIKTRDVGVSVECISIVAYITPAFVTTSCVITPRISMARGVMPTLIVVLEKFFTSELKK